MKLLFSFSFVLITWSVSAQPGTLKRLTNVRDSYPMLSPDGIKLIFQSNRTGDTEIYVMNTDGSQLRQLTSQAGFDGCPQWSPDGQRVVFASERDEGDSEIYVMQADGSAQTRLTRTPGDDSHPHWSPDGQRIIFNSARTTPDIKAPWSKQFIEIFEMRADGSQVRQLTHLKSLCTFPSYSPDGKRILYRQVIDGPAFQWNLSPASRNSEVFVVNADGSNPVNISTSAAFDGWPCWSPDGRRIVFASNRNGPANVGQLFLVNADGTNLRQLTYGPGSFVQPSWSGDGKKVVAYQHWETPEYEYGNIAEIEVDSTPN